MCLLCFVLISISMETVIVIIVIVLIDFLFFVFQIFLADYNVGLVNKPTLTTSRIFVHGYSSL